MSWSELVNAIRPNRLPARVNLVLCGRAAARLPRVPGAALDDGEIVTVHQAKYTSNDDDVTGVLEVVRLAVPEETLLKHVVPDDGERVTIIALDWLADTSTWPADLAEAVQVVPNGSKLVLTAVNFEQGAKLWRSSAVLGEKIDACHQFLRASALKHNAPLVYTTGADAEIDWLAVVTGTTGAPFTSRPAPAEQLVADPVFASYGSDTKEHILAINPIFDFDAAVAGTLSLESLTTPETLGNSGSELSLEGVLAEFDERNQGARMSEETAAESQKLVYDGVGVSEDRRVISEFFTKIAQRSK